MRRVARSTFADGGGLFEILQSVDNDPYVFHAPRTLLNLNRIHYETGPTDVGVCSR
jgi:hypothetical protein